MATTISAQPATIAVAAQAIANEASASVSRVAHFAASGPHGGPRAVYDAAANRTWVAFLRGSDADLWATYYDHDIDKVAAPALVATFPFGSADFHHVPAVMLADDGKLHIIWAGHNGAHRHYRMDNPRDLTSWTSQSLDAGTYPFAIVTDDGELIFTDRPGSGHGSTFPAHEFGAMHRSTDGSTWTRTEIVDTSGFAESHADFYQRDLVWHDGKVHMVWTVSRGTDHGGDQIDLHYAAFDPDASTWVSADGTDLGAVIGSAEHADCVVASFTSGWMRAALTFHNDEPVIAFAAQDAGGIGEIDDFLLRVATWDGSSTWDISTAIATAEGPQGRNPLIRSTSDGLVLIGHETGDDPAARDVVVWRLDGGSWVQDSTALVESNGIEAAADLIPVHAGPAYGVTVLYEAEDSYSATTDTRLGEMLLLGDVVEQPASAYRVEVLDDSPVGYWPYHERSGHSTAEDLSGNGNDGTHVNDPDVGLEGIVDLAVRYNKNFSERTDLPISVPTSALSVEVWLRTTDTDRRTVIARMEGSGGERAFYISVNDGASNRASAAVIADGSFIQVTADAVDVTDGDWHQIVLTYDGSSLVIYVDGADRGSTAASGSLGTTTVVNVAVREGHGSPEHISARIDEISIYDKALSAARVQARYDAATATSVSVSAQPATLSIAAQAPTVNVARIISAQPALVTAAAQIADVNVARIIQAQPATSTVAAQAANVDNGSSTAIQAQPATLAAAAQAPTVSLAALSISAQPATLAVSAQAANVALGALAVSAQPASVTTTAQPAKVNDAVAIQAQPASITTSAQAAMVSIADIADQVGAVVDLIASVGETQGGGFAVDLESEIVSASEINATMDIDLELTDVSETVVDQIRRQSFVMGDPG